MAQFRFRTSKILWQFRFNTINLVRLEVSQFRFHTRALTLSPAVPPPHKEYSVTWSSLVSLPHKEYTMSRNQQFCFRTQNNLWLEVPQFRTIYCDLNFRSSASARKDVIWNSAPLLLHKNIIFLWKIHSHLLTPPPPHHFLIFALSYMNDGPSEGRETKESGCSWQKSSLTFGCARHKLMTQFATKRPDRLRATTARKRQYTLTSTLLNGDSICQTLWIICQYDP